MMSGITDEIDVEDARGIAEFMVATGQIPPIQQWADGLIERQKVAAVEGMF